MLIAATQSMPARMEELFRGGMPSGVDDACAGQQAVADSVAISPEGRWLSRLLEMPEIRPDRVEQLRAAIAAEQYDVEGKLDAALDRMLEELALEQLADRMQRPRRV